MELTISDEKMKDLVKEVMIEMVKEQRGLFYELILEALEEIGLAQAIAEGRKDDFVSEEQNFGNFRGLNVEILFEASFEKDLRRIKEKKLLTSVKEVIDEVKKAEGLSDIKNLKKLKGYETFYRVRLGDYRIGLDVAEDKVIFARVLHRKEIYRYFP